MHEVLSRVDNKPRRAQGKPSVVILSDLGDLRGEVCSLRGPLRRAPAFLCGAGLSSDGFGCGWPEGHLALLHVRVDGERIAGGDFAVEQFHGQRVLDEPLDGALEEPRPEMPSTCLQEEGASQIALSVPQTMG